MTENIIMLNLGGFFSSGYKSQLILQFQGTVLFTINLTSSYESDISTFQMICRSDVNKLCVKS